MSSKHKRYRPYVRRMKPGDKADDFRTAICLEFYREIKRKAWVLAQHGFPGRVIGVDSSKRALMQSPLVVAVGRKTFKQWARDTQRYASGADNQKPGAF